MPPSFPGIRLTIEKNNYTSQARRASLLSGGCRAMKHARLKQSRLLGWAKVREGEREAGA